MRRLFSTLLSLANLSAFTAPAGAALLIVPDDYPTIQSAIAAGASGDSIMVRSGVYAESLSLTAKNLTLFGESGAQATIISGSSSFRLLDATGDSTATVLEDLTFRDGKVVQGAGMRLSGGASLIVRRCRFIHNLAEGDPGGAAGGAAWVGPQSSLVVDASLFQDNEAYYLDATGDGSGGAIYADLGSHLEVRNSEFINNTTSGFEGGFGGAINVNGIALIEACRFTEGFGWEGGGIRGSELSDIVVRGCFFGRNEAWTGAGIYCRFAKSVITDNTFIDNDSWFGLDAALVAVSSQGIIEHNTFDFNYASGIGVGGHGSIIVRNNIVTNNRRFGFLYQFAPAPGSVACNDVWSNDAGNYGGNSPDLTGVNGNISSDPLFCPAMQDLTLDAASPCAPPNSPAGCGLIGAWPVACGVTPVGPFDAPGLEARLSVRPNPTGRVSEFAFDAAMDPRVLEIVDGQGRVVAVLEARGRTTLTWVPPPSVPAGVYFARLSGTTGRSETVKIVILH